MGWDGKKSFSCSIAQSPNPTFQARKNTTPPPTTDIRKTRRLDNYGWTAHIITTSADGAQSVFAIDMDGDGDVDVLSASEYDDTIAWYENLGRNQI